MKRVSTISLAVIITVLAGSSFAGIYNGGDGTEGDPYQIGTAENIIEMSETEADWDDCFVMVADVNMVGYTFTTAVIETFTGKFDGGEHKVLSLTINTQGADNDFLGLFGHIIGESAEVKNLGLENVTIIGGDYSQWLGGLCGMNFEGNINNCYSRGSVTGGVGSWWLGGLCGDNWLSGRISNSYATGSVTGGEDSWMLGGLCGDNEGGTVINCYSEGTVEGGDEVGGLCGGNYRGTISSCYSECSVSGYKYLGGLCGLNRDTISGCYSTGLVTGDEYPGGLCGYQKDSVAQMINSFWDTDTSSMSIGYHLDPEYPGTVTNVLGKTTSEMQTKETFTNVGWDFSVTWFINEGVDYPKLRGRFAGDFDFDRDVDLCDFDVFSSVWLSTPDDLELWNPYCNLYDTEDGGTFDPNSAVIDTFDLAVFADNWLSDLTLVGHWALNEMGGSTAVDSSVYGRDGVLFNMDQSDWVEGYDGNCLEFDGIDDYVAMTGYKGIEGNRSRTCMAWIKPAVFTDIRSVISWGSNETLQKWLFGLYNTELGVLVQGGNVFCDASSIIDGEWHHIAVVFGEEGSAYINDVRFYIDGAEQQISRIDSCRVQTGATYNVKIGEYAGGSYFKGLIDDVRIYDRALSAEEVAVLAD